MSLPRPRIVVSAAAAFAISLGHPTLASDCTHTSVGRVPLNDLGAGLYLGQFQGGLYAGGSNQVPAGPDAIGRARSAVVQPRNAAGNLDPAGKIVLLSIGMSNTTQEFCSQNSLPPCNAWTFMGRATTQPSVNHSTLVIVNGAEGGQAAPSWDSPTDPDYDAVRDQKLVPAGVTEAQVQAAWLKEADAGPTVSLPNANADAYQLQTTEGNIVRAMKVRYPNLQMVFISNRIYAGYASTTLNPEPYAYESGFAVKWLVQAQIDQMNNGGVIVDPRGGDLNYNTIAPWIVWGPNLWADGTTPRSDGLTYVCSDLESDGTHPATSGETKVGTMLLQFMLASPYSSPWFAACARGDVNNDGQVNAGDVPGFVAVLLDPAGATARERCATDFNGDGRPNGADV